MSYVGALAICLLLVYFVGAAGCHCFDYNRKVQIYWENKLHHSMKFLFILIQHLEGSSEKILAKPVGGGLNSNILKG